VINVDDWAEIRRLHRAKGMGIKAIRRLGPYAPSHRGLNVTRALAALERAEADLREELVECDPQPPVAVEEEQQAEGDQRGA